MALRFSCNSRVWGGAALAIGLIACAGDPADLPAEMHDALRTGDVAAVERLLTAPSRPLWRALRIARGDRGVGLGLAGQPPVVRNVAPQGSRLVLTVHAGTVERDWVLVNEGDRYRLDLNETSIRRPWNLP